MKKQGTKKAQKVTAAEATKVKATKCTKAPKDTRPDWMKAEVLRLTDPIDAERIEAERRDRIERELLAIVARKNPARTKRVLQNFFDLGKRK